MDIPLVSGSVGVVLGGVVSDWLMRKLGRSAHLRVLIASQVCLSVCLSVCTCQYMSVCLYNMVVYLNFGIFLLLIQILAAPFLIGVLFLPPPWAFLILLPAYVVVRCGLVCLVTVVELVFVGVGSAAVALYLFIINRIGD